MINYLIIRECSSGESIEAYSSSDEYILNYLKIRKHLVPDRKYRVVMCPEKGIPAELQSYFDDKLAEQESMDIEIDFNNIFMTGKNIAVAQDLIEHDIEFVYNDFHTINNIHQYLKLDERESEIFLKGIEIAESVLNDYLFDEDSYDEDMCFDKSAMVASYIKDGCLD